MPLYINTQMVKEKNQNNKTNNQKNPTPTKKTTEKTPPQNKTYMFSRTDPCILHFYIKQKYAQYEIFKRRLSFWFCFTGINLIEKFHLEVRKKNFLLKTVRQWSRLPREVVQPSAWEIFKPWLEKSQSNLVWPSSWPCLSRRLNWRLVEVPSNWYCPIILQ